MADYYYTVYINGRLIQLRQRVSAESMRDAVREIDKLIRADKSIREPVSIRVMRTFEFTVFPNHDR